MKNIFPGHFKHEEAKLAEIWENSLFVFDANILLNLYRYSDTSRKDFLALMEQVKERSFLPHQAAAEYLKNRTTTINVQEKSYSDSISGIGKVRNSIKESTQHPFVNSEILDKLDGVFDELKTELNENKAIHTARIVNDDIKDFLGLVFDGRTGESYADETLIKIIEDGAKRYEQQIPPGYMDAKTKKVNDDCKVLKDRCRPYGDLILWKQLLDKAKSEDNGVIFITDDSKEDWWELSGKVTIGPRPELTEEFVSEVNKDFHMYSAEKFLALANKYLGYKASDETLKEVQEVSHREAVKAVESQLSIKNFEEDKEKVMLREHIKVQLDSRSKHIKKIKEEIDGTMKYMQLLLMTHRDTQHKLDSVGDNDSSLHEQLEHKLSIENFQIEECDRKIKMKEQQVEISMRELRSGEHSLAALY